MVDTLENVYCVKYALTQGIFLVRGKQIAGGYFSEERSGTRLGLFLTKNEWRHTLEEAKQIAEEKRIQKIKSLKKQIEKLEALEFKIRDTVS